jgi:hypothetical protein
VLQELEAIWRKAQTEIGRRYHTAGEIHRELLRVAGRRIRVRLKRFERTMRLVRRAWFDGPGGARVAARTGYLIIKEQASQRTAPARKVGSIAYGNHALADGDLLGRFPGSPVARGGLLLDKNDLIHRTRLGLARTRPDPGSNVFQNKQIKEALFADRRTK